MASMELVGKTLRSKINGKVFCVTELRKENNYEQYIVCEISSGKLLPVHRRTFEEMCLTYLEFIEEN